MSQETMPENQETGDYELITGDTEPDRCPYCNHETDAYTGIRGTAPQEGDISVCLYCMMPAVYCADLKLRRVTLDEYIDFIQHPDYQRIMEVFAEMEKNNNEDETPS